MVLHTCDKGKRAVAVHPHIFKLHFVLPSAAEHIAPTLENLTQGLGNNKQTTRPLGKRGLNLHKIRMAPSLHLIPSADAE